MPNQQELLMRMRLWLEDGNEFALGPGRVRLLEEIRERGSLHQAAKALGMSYRRAWGQLKKREESLGIALLVKSGGNKSGYELTDYALELMQAYTRWNDAVTEFALTKSRELFPGNLRTRIGESPAGASVKRRKSKKS